MEFANIAAVAVISLFAAISPGPDFAVVIRSCLWGGFRAGFLTTLGVTSALLGHVTYCLFGIGVLIKETPWLFHSLKYLGAAYLFYLGVMLLKEKVPKEGLLEAYGNRFKETHNYFMSGFLCNLLNPKATLFILSIFSQFVARDMDFFSKVMMGSAFAFIVFIWFTILSFLITHHLLQKHFIKFQNYIMKTMGVILCLLGFYVALVS